CYHPAHHSFPTRRSSDLGGRFSFSFIVPLDINYSYGNGAIKYYAFDSTSDLNGSFSGITVGGFSETAMDDTEGPQIRLFMNDTRSEEHTSELQSRENLVC